MTTDTEVLAYLSEDLATVMEEARRPKGTYAQLSAIKRIRIKKLVVDPLPKMTETQLAVFDSYVIKKTEVRKTWKLVEKPEDRAGDALLEAFDQGIATPHEVQRAIAWLLRQERPEK